MNVGRSAYVEWLREPASEKVLKDQIATLLSVVSVESSTIVETLTQFPLRNAQLEELAKWNQYLAPSPARDSIGTKAAEFFVAQTLATTVMRPKALDESFSYGFEVDAVMAKGGDGLFDVGRPQFELLAHMSKSLVNWLLEKGYRRPLVVESPLGNSLVVQVLADYAAKRGCPVESYIWMTPRNERPNRGITLRESAKWLKDAAVNNDAVILIDDVTTGTRFNKMLKEILRELGEDRLVAIALAVPLHNAKDEKLRQKLKARLLELSIKHGFDPVWCELPRLPLFKFDNGEDCRWQHSLVWQDSDLIAGKRKVNLIFTLLDHLFFVIADLASEQSDFRNRLEQAWSQNTVGEQIVMAPGLTQSVFHKINTALQRDGLKAKIENAARTEFPSDYEGKILLSGDEYAFVKQRWDWMRTSFIAAAAAAMKEDLGWLAWNAFQDVFASTLSDQSPRPDRDHAFVPHVFPFNSTIRKLNVQLRARIAEMNI